MYVKGLPDRHANKKQEQLRKRGQLSCRIIQEKKGYSIIYR